MYPPVGGLQIQPEFSPQENTSMPSRLENTLRDAWQDNDQFIVGYHIPPQNHSIQQTPPRHDIVTSPNEVISTLIEKVRGLELAQASQNLKFIQIGSSNSPHHPSQVDLLTGVGTLGMTP